MGVGVWARQMIQMGMCFIFSAAEKRGCYFVRDPERPIFSAAAIWGPRAALRDSVMWGILQFELDERDMADGDEDESRHESALLRVYYTHSNCWRWC